MIPSRNTLTLLCILTLAIQSRAVFAEQTASADAPATMQDVETPATLSEQADEQIILAPSPEAPAPAEQVALSPESASPLPTSDAATEAPTIELIKKPRLYAMPCGTAKFADFGGFSDTGEYEGEEQTVVTACYLIRHPKGDLLWDLGLGDALAELPDGLSLQDGMIQLKVENPLLPQLAQIKVRPQDVEFIAFSHLHFDHTGNANAFAGSTWLMNKQEWAAARSKPTPFGVEPKHFSAHKNAKMNMIQGDHDVFGDGSVRILSAPGHTPGHQVLMVRLDEFGTVILSGDLYHTRENRTDRRIPSFNHDRANTLASMDRIEQWVRNRKAMFVIQHVAEDLEKLPPFPEYLD